MVPYALTCMNPMIPVIERLYNETYMNRHGEELPENTWTLLLSMTMSMVLIGAFVGSLSFKLLLNCLTRKQVMITLHVLNASGYVIIAIGGGIWGAYEAFVLGKFVTGLGLGLGLSIIPLIINETSVPHRREFYSAVFGTSMSSGSVIGVFVGWSKVLGTDETWVGVMLFGMITSAVYLGGVYWIEETPYQAKLKYGNQQAKRILEKLRSGGRFSSDLEMEMKSLLGETSDGSTEGGVATLSEVLTTPQYRRHFIGSIVLFSYMMICGLNNILFFSDQIFLSANVDPEVVTPATLGVLSMGPIVSVGGMFLLKFIEPKKLLLFGSVVMILGDIFMTTSQATYEQIPAMTYGAIAAVFVFYFGYMFLNLLALMIVGSITIDRTRPVCTNIGGAALWFSAWLVGFLATYLKIWIGPFAFLVWMGFTIIITVYIIFYLPNTKGKTSEEIQEFYKNN
nr:solute carrier family 2, facilitated glucose transporter member 5-like isoform X2 [Styela clava]